MKILEEGKISGSQFMWCLVIAVLPTAVLFVPAMAVQQAGTSAWFDALVVDTLYGLAVVWICSTLGERFAGRSIVDYSGEILGKPLGKLIGVFYIFVFIYTNSIIVREFGEFLVSAFMPETPMMVFNIILFGLAAYAVRSGIEVIARMNQFIVSLMFFALVFVFTLVLQEADFHHLLPVFEGGVKPLLRGALTPSVWRGEVFLLLFLLPYLNNYTEAKSAGYKAVLLVGLVLSIDVLMTLAVFGQGEAADMVFPIHALATYISVAGFLERLEAFILALWVGGIMVKVAIWLYCGALVTAQTFSLTDYKPLVLPLTVIGAVWSATIFDNARELVMFFTSPFFTFALLFEFIVPLFLLTVAMARKKGGPSG